MADYTNDRTRLLGTEVKAFICWIGGANEGYAVAGQQVTRHPILDKTSNILDHDLAGDTTSAIDWDAVRRS